MFCSADAAGQTLEKKEEIGLEWMILLGEHALHESDWEVKHATVGWAVEHTQQCKKVGGNWMQCTSAAAEN